MNEKSAKNSTVTQQNWKKPRGVLKALNAFDGNGSGKSKPHSSVAQTSKNRMKKTGTLIKAVNNLSSSRPKPTPTKPVVNKSKLFRQSGTLIKAVNAIGARDAGGGSHVSGGSASVNQITSNQSRSITSGMVLK